MAAEGDEPEMGASQRTSKGDGGSGEVAPGAQKSWGCDGGGVPESKGDGSSGEVAPGAQKSWGCDGGGVGEPKGDGGSS